MRNVLRNAKKKLTLSALDVERLKSGSLGDPAYPGLRIMVRRPAGGKPGRKVWIYRYRDPSGKMAQLLLGTFPALSLGDARSLWRDARAIRDKDGDPRHAAKERKKTAATQAERSRGYTVRQAAEHYLEEHLSQLARGAEQWRILERDILPGIGGRLLSELSEWDVMSVVTPIRKRAPRVAAMALSAIRGLRVHAKKMHRLQLGAPDPTADIPAVPQRKRQRALSDSEIVALLHWLDTGAVSQNIADVLRVTLYTGARTGEVCAMRSRDVDLEARTWTHVQTKTGDVALTALSPPAITILRDRLSSEFAFEIRRRPIQQKALTVATWAARGAGKGCPIDEDWTPHDLRRTVRTGLARLGCPFEVAESVLGHRLPGVSGVYNVYQYVDEMRRWLDRWGEHLAVQQQERVVSPRSKKSDRGPGRSIDHMRKMSAAIVRELHIRHGIKVAAAVSSMVSDSEGTEESRRLLKQNIERAYRYLKAPDSKYQVGETLVLEALDRITAFDRKKSR